MRNAAWQKHLSRPTTQPRNSLAFLRANNGFNRRRSSGYRTGYKLGQAYGKKKGQIRKEGVDSCNRIAASRCSTGMDFGNYSIGEKKQAGSGGDDRWRIRKHWDFLLDLTKVNKPFANSINSANTVQIRALTDLIRNTFDGVIEIPREVKLKSKNKIEELKRLSARTTPLYERRKIISVDLGARNLRPLTLYSLHSLSSL